MKTFFEKTINLKKFNMTISAGDQLSHMKQGGLAVFFPVMIFNNRSVESIFGLLMGPLSIGISIIYYKKNHYTRSGE